MKNTLLTAIIIIICFQNLMGQTRTTNKIDGERSELECRKIGLLKNTDHFSHIEKHDTIIITYKYFTVAKKMIETSENIYIYPNGNSTAILHKSSYYFLGIIKDRYAIFDEGTTATRGLMIYDLMDNEELINITYQGNLFIENNSIHYKTTVQADAIKIKPKCPPAIDKLPNRIYLEEQYYDFQNLKTIHTGNYICSFME